ncbi:hypothetical protein U1Q18_023404 [Sarracenia purpurea var. burkii]
MAAEVIKKQSLAPTGTPDQEVLFREDLASRLGFGTLRSEEEMRHFRRRSGQTDLRRKQWAEKKLPTGASSTGAVSGGERKVKERERRRGSSSPPSPAFFFARGCRSPMAIKSQT